MKADVEPSPSSVSAAAPGEVLLSVENVSLSFGGVRALRDVSFDIRKGEIRAIIGPNGAGKSTLLKLLSRVTDPTEGQAEIHGRVGSLLEVGTGFHPELTGRENIYLNGAILGMKRVEIEKKFDEIVAFSGVERFLDTPVKRYSSGMYVRLAFAVAAHLEPEILVVDEVLAVGDAEFQKKCVVLRVSGVMNCALRYCRVPGTATPLLTPWPAGAKVVSRVKMPGTIIRPILRRSILSVLFEMTFL